MLLKTKRLRHKIFIPGALLITIFLLIIVGGLVKNNFFSRQGLIKPVGEESIKQQTERVLKEWGVKEGLDLLTEPEVTDNSLIATFSSQLTCILSLKKEIPLQLASLQFIFWRSKIEGRQPKTIDLRFDKPVIKYNL